MTHKGARRIALLCLIVLILSMLPFSALSAEYRTLQEGDSGSDVLRLKTRLYYLGYFKTSNLSDAYNETTVERVKQFQKKNGLQQTGIATPELQELLFSDDCIYQAPTPRPSAVPVSAEETIIWPETDEQGFLASGLEPFVYENAEDGLWAYISQDIHIEIRRCEDPALTLIWFETTVVLSERTKLRSMLVPGKKKSNFQQPASILAAHGNVILAFSDDFFGYRTRYEGKREGVIIRDGEIIAESTVKASSRKFPPLEILALFEDGSLKTYESDEKTAKEYLEMGVTDTYAFGPILVSNGEISQGVYTYEKTDRNPRTALGMIEPRKYLVLTALGRRKDSKGASYLWLAEKMLEKGVTEAMNLDGGNTCSLIFRGKLLNRTENVKKNEIRYVSGLIGVIEEEHKD